jgi:dTDP-4-amino-4,6-dideoxygalactose transaminase
VARIYLSPPDLVGTELEMLRDALDSNWIAPLGPHVDAFEAEVATRVGVPHAVALSSGTAALHLALEVLEVGAGHDVWVSTLTFAASANAIRYVGANPVFIDSHRDTWNIDPDLLEQALASAAREGRLPRALIMVELYGHCAGIERIATACRTHGVYLIEDAAESLGSSSGGLSAGSFGDLAVLSFNGNKIITTSGGGMLLSRNRDWVERARYLATQARSPARHYEHEVVGYNYRLSNLLAAVGRAQLRDLDRRVFARRRHNAEYRAALETISGVRFLEEASGQHCNFWLTTLTLDPTRTPGRDVVLEALAALDIEGRPVWKPMHLQPVFRGCEVRGGDVAAELFATGLCLPSGSAMTDVQRDAVVGCVRKVCSR